MRVYFILLAAFLADPQVCPPCICVCNSTRPQFFDYYGMMREPYRKGDRTSWRIPSAFVACMTGPGSSSDEPMCGWNFDRDYDEDVDLRDWAGISNRASTLEKITQYIPCPTKPADDAWMFVKVLDICGPGKDVWPEQRWYDADGDGDVDLRDWALRVNTWHKP